MKSANASSTSAVPWTSSLEVALKQMSMPFRCRDGSGVLGYRRPVEHVERGDVR